MKTLQEHARCIIGRVHQARHAADPALWCITDVEDMLKNFARDFTKWQKFDVVPASVPNWDDEQHVEMMRRNSIGGVGNLSQNDDCFVSRADVLRLVHIIDNLKPQPVEVKPITRLHDVNFAAEFGKLLDTCSDRYIEANLRGALRRYIAGEPRPPVVMTATESDR